MPKRYLAHILLFTVNWIYAANLSIAKIAMPAHIQPNAFIVLRAGIGALAFFLFHEIYIKEKVDKQDWPRMILCGMFGVAINMLMFFKGLAITTPINAGLIMILAPIFVLIISSIVLKEMVNAQKIIGVFSGLFGGALIILSGSSLAELTISRGDLFILINATSYAIYLVMVKSLMQKYEAFTVVRWVFFFGFLMVLPFGFHQLQDVEWNNLPRNVWLSIAFVLFGTTILTYLFNAMALKISSATLVSTYIYLQPLLATVIAVAMRTDKLDSRKLIAGVFIFLGVFLVSQKRVKTVK